MALILMYHNVVASEKERQEFHPAHRLYVLTKSEFDRHIEIAIELKWRFLRCEDLYTEAVDDPKGLLLTFDDAWENSAAVEVLEKRGIQGIFFLTSGEIGLPMSLSADAIRTMAERGQEIGSHGAKHEFLTRLDEGELRKSLGESKKAIEDITGKRVRFLSAPGGRFDGVTTRVAKEVGYEAFFVSLPGFCGRVGKDFLMKRIGIAARIDAGRFRRMLLYPRLLVLRRKAKYRINRARALFSRKHGGEGH